MNNEKNQGEGNREAAKEYNDAARDFIQSGGVEENKHKHINLTDEEKNKLREAEEKGKDKAKG